MAILSAFFQKRWINVYIGFLFVFLFLKARFTSCSGIIFRHFIFDFSLTHDVAFRLPMISLVK